MDFCRRGFLTGSFASFMAGAMRVPLFAASDDKFLKKKPKIVFGVVSDTHLRTHYDGVNFYRHYETVMGDDALKAVFKYFKSENADAVVNCGDLTDRGMIRSMELYKEAWDSVFGKGALRPQHLYATGNHDVEEGFFDWAKGVARSEDPKVYQKLCLGANLVPTMNRVWGGQYDDVWHKVINGVHFFGFGWGNSPDDWTPVYHGRIYKDSPMEGESCSQFVHKGLWMTELVRREREAGRLNPAKPFFLAYHCDIDRYDRRQAIIHTHLTKALGLEPGEYCNGLGLFGHGHRSLVDWHFFWNNKASLPSIQCSTLAYWKGAGGGGDKPRFAQGFGDETAEGADNTKNHALLVKVYDDAVVLRRLWVAVKPKIVVANHGQDLVLPLRGFLPANHPAKDDYLRTVDERPEFRRGAKIEVSMIGEKLVVKIPKADGREKARVLGFHLVVIGDEAKLRKSFYANGYAVGDGYEPNQGITEISIPKADLPDGKKLTIAVRPLSWLGTKGSAIAATYSIPTGTVRKFV